MLPNAQVNPGVVVMGTYTFQVLRAESDFFGNFTGAGTSQLSINGPDSFDSLRYQVITSYPQGVSEIQFQDLTQSYNITIDGVLQQPYSQGLGQTLTTTFTWGGGLVSHVMNFAFPAANGAVEYLLVLGGSALPTVTNLAQLNSFLASVSGLSNFIPPSIGPGVDIPLIGLPGVTFTDNDTIQGSAASETFDGGQGVDEIHGAGGNDSLIGGLATDRLFGDAGDDTLDGGDGRDNLRGGDDDDLISGGAEGDFIFGEGGSDTLMGDGGDDLLRGGADRDTVLGGAGMDMLEGGKGRDRLEGGDNDDTVDGGQGRDNVLGGKGNDVVNGGGSRDRINGGKGADTVSGGTGDDTISGGLGADEFRFARGDDRDFLVDFTDDIDAVVFDSALWGGGVMTGQEIVEQFASLVDGIAIFDFGGGDILTVANVSGLSDLYNDVSAEMF